MHFDAPNPLTQYQPLGMDPLDSIEEPAGIVKVWGWDHPSGA